MHVVAAVTCEGVLFLDIEWKDGAGREEFKAMREEEKERRTEGRKERKKERNIYSSTTTYLPI